MYDLYVLLRRSCCRIGSAGDGALSYELHSDESGIGTEQIIAAARMLGLPLSRAVSHRTEYDSTRLLHSLRFGVPEGGTQCGAARIAPAARKAGLCARRLLPLGGAGYLRCDVDRTFSRDAERGRFLRGIGFAAWLGTINMLRCRGGTPTVYIKKS